jgi:hypothetical protein
MPITVKMKMVTTEAILRVVETMGASRHVNNTRTGNKASAHENKRDVLNWGLRSVATSLIPSTRGSNAVRISPNHSHPTTKRIMESNKTRSKGKGRFIA